MLFQMAWFLVSLTAELALVWPVIACHFQVLLKSQARVLGCNEPCYAACEIARYGHERNKVNFVQKIKTHMKKHQESKWIIQLSSSQCTTISVNIYQTFIYIAEFRFIYMNHMLLPKSVMRMGSCSGISGRGRLLLDTLALLDFRGNLCFFCCKLLKWEAMCVFLWPDVRKILSQWGQGNGRTPKQWGKTAFRELAFRELIVMWLIVMYVLCTIKTKLHIK